MAKARKGELGLSILLSIVYLGELTSGHGQMGEKSIILFEDLADTTNSSLYFNRDKFVIKGRLNISNHDIKSFALERIQQNKTVKKSDYICFEHFTRRCRDANSNGCYCVRTNDEHIFGLVFNISLEVSDSGLPVSAVMLNTNHKIYSNVITLPTVTVLEHKAGGHLLKINDIPVSIDNCSVWIVDDQIKVLFNITSIPEHLLQISIDGIILRQNESTPYANDWREWRNSTLQYSACGRKIGENINCIFRKSNQTNLILFIIIFVPLITITLIVLGIIIIWKFKLKNNVCMKKVETYETPIHEEQATRLMVENTETQICENVNGRPIDVEIPLLTLYEKQLDVLIDTETQLCEDETDGPIDREAQLYKDETDGLIETDNSVNLFMIGNSKEGKSATGNCILGEKIFKSLIDSESITLSIQAGYKEYNGITYCVFDGPGFHLNPIRDIVMKSLDEAFLMKPDGFDAFLLIMRYGSLPIRNENIQLLEQKLGEDFIAKYCIIVITYKDMFEEVDSNCRSIEDWSSGQTGYFATLVEKCKGRIVYFDNKSKDENIKKEQLRKLFVLVGEIRRYNNMAKCNLLNL